MPFTKISCSYCHVYIHTDERIHWRDDRPYHSHHSQYHVPTHVVAQPKNPPPPPVRRIPRFGEQY